MLTEKVEVYIIADFVLDHSLTLISSLKEASLSFNENFKNLKFDKRMKDWNIKQGSVTESEFENHLSSLEDVKDQGVNLSLEKSIEKSPDLETDKLATGTDQATGDEDSKVEDLADIDEDPH